MRRSLVVSLALILLGGVCLAQDDTPLGDVARKKSATKAKHVVTEDDVPSTASPAPAVEPVKKAAPVNEAELAAPSIPEKNDDGTALTPQQKLQSMEQRAAKLQDFERSLEKHLKQVAERLEKEPSEFRRNMYSEAIERQTVTLETFKKESAQLETAIAKQKEAQAKDESGSDESKPESNSDKASESSSESPSD